MTGNDPFVDEFVRSRANQSLAHVFTVLSLVLPAEPLQIALRGLHADDTHLRGTALEYLESILPPMIREPLWPFLEDHRPAGRTVRPREDVLADLVRSNHFYYAEPGRNQAANGIKPWQTKNNSSCRANRRPHPGGRHDRFHQNTARGSRNRPAWTACAVQPYRHCAVDVRSAARSARHDDRARRLPGCGREGPRHRGGRHHRLGRRCSCTSATRHTHQRPRRMSVSCTCSSTRSRSPR